jgi:hypothetical protein
VTGDWDGAVSEMEAVLSDELDAGNRIIITTNAAIIHAARGQSIDAMLAEVEQLGAGWPAEGWRAVVMDPQANRALAQGKPDEARRAWRHLVELDHSQANEFLYRAGVAALWTGERRAVAQDLAELDSTGVHGRVAKARHLSLQAGLAALDGKTAAAVTLYGEALAAWRELRTAWDEALTAITMTKLLDPSMPEVPRPGACRAVHRATRCGDRARFRGRGGPACSGPGNIARRLRRGERRRPLE